MNIRRLLIALSFVGAVTVASAQDVVVIDGAKYAIHNVAQGDTLYGLSRRYGVTVDEIVAANKSLEEGLKAGTKIKIPYNDAVVEQPNKPQAQPQSQVQESSSDDTQSHTHVVSRRETLYSLAKLYDVTMEALQELNPNIRRGLKVGQILKIPSKRNAPQTEAASSQTAPQDSVAADTLTVVERPKERRYRSILDQLFADIQSAANPSDFRTLYPGITAEVALLLPLGSEEKPAQNYLDFYRGFLMGLDSVRMSGYSVNLTLYNTAHDYNRVSAIVESGALQRADLVVGPIYEDELIPVATSLMQKRTPIVSPLANLTHTESNLVFQMSPSPATKFDKVRGLFDGSKRVVIISTDKVDKEFDAEVRSMLQDSLRVVEHKYIYEHPSVIEAREKQREKDREAGLTVDDTPSPSDMSPLLRGTEPTVIVITADNEVEVDRILAAIASANIALTSRSQRVVPFVIYGNNRWNRYRGIDRSIFFTNHVTMLSTYHARRSEPIIRAFDKRFVEEFNTLPSLYAYRGYDAAVVFVKALYGALDTGLEGAHSMPLLTPYVFEQNPTTGVRINNQWVKVNYNSDFTITTE